MNQSFSEKKIAIKNLSLWTENARFPDKFFNSNENELINYFVSKPSFKIKNLIDEIIKDIDLPQMEKIIVWKEDDKLIVLEGNRRLTGYKLLINPEIISETNQSLYKYLKEKKEEIKIDEDFVLDSLISEDKEQCFRYIDRKHSNGNNEVSWLEPERMNYSKRRGSESQNSKLKLAITNFVRELDLPEDIKNKVLGKGYVTTFYRFLATGPAKDTFGLSTDKDGNLTFTDNKFTEKLKVIIYNVLKKRDFKGNIVDTRYLNKNPQIKVFLESIDSKDSKKVEKEIAASTQKDIFGNKLINLPKEKINEASSNNQQSIRNKPIPKGLFHSVDVPIKIGNSSLRTLYDELRNISVYEFPNATHDLLRSFLECSLIFFFKEINEYKKIKKNDAHNPKLGDMLSHVINGKCEKISDGNLINSLKAIKTDFDQPYSLERMNMINHNENCISTEKDVRKSWAQLESLFKLILNPEK